MLSNLGWPEVIVLALVGLMVFGPDRLPKAIRDLSRLLRQLRTMARGAADDLKAELGPEMADLDLRSLHPRRFVENALFGEDDPADGDTAQVTLQPATATLEANERPPYDADAT